MDILSGRFRGWLAKASLGLALIAATAFFSFLAWRGYLAASESLAIDERSMGQSSFPIWPGKILLCAGCVIAALESLRQFVRLLLGLEDPSIHGEGLS